ncbi:DUF6527 family protein [Sagittula sp.]|uniref:DUF6527 family protein n=1 Tax=Sagittula sp. TaxID=2038081 RepID=UPI0035110761
MTARVEHESGEVSFECPGCGWTHVLNLDTNRRPAWSFNGDLARPTITPSINAWLEDGNGNVKKRCRSWVRDGRIQFLGDCTHALRGQTVDLPEIQP